MRYDQLNRYSDPAFKRLVGVSRIVFREMLDIIHQAEQPELKSGRPDSSSKLSHRYSNFHLINYII